MTTLLSSRTTAICEETLAELVGSDVNMSFIEPGPPTNFASASPWFAALRTSVLQHIPDAVVVPYCTGGGTDAKSFARLGIECFGFAPLTADPGGRTTAGMHGVNERVPISSVEGGQRLLTDFLLTV